MTTDVPQKRDKPLFSGNKVLWVGCALILVVMCLSTADIIYSLRQTSVRSEAVISAFRQRTRLLDTLRGLMIRSALAPDSGGQRAMDDSELPATHAEANRVVEQIVKSSEASGDASTGNRLADLRNSIDQYWDALPAIRERNGAMPEATQRLRSSPERRQVRRIARQINALNRDQQDRAEAQLNAEQRRLQAELLVSSVLAFVIVLALVAVMSYRIKRAERLAEMQYRSMAQAKTELQNFAARLEQAQEEERRTLSRELHDAFGQTMAAALVELSRIQEAMTHDDGTRAQLASVKLELESSMRSIRDIALVLRTTRSNTPRPPPS